MSGPNALDIVSVARAGAARNQSSEAAYDVTSERLKQIEEMYHAAIAHPEPERDEFLRAACAGDDDLRGEVESLLAHESGIAGKLDAPALAVLGSTLVESESLVGLRLGPYQVTTALGAGGMGEVYRATDTQLGRDVAIKVLPAAFSAFPERLRRFEQEARMLAALNHPNIGAIYGLADDRGVRGLILELVEGPTLADRLRAGPVGISETLSIARQIADALKAAHEKGIVHRDLKPANIKITPEGVVKVLDFGIAKASVSNGMNTGTREGVLLGTAAYMSPEQARGQPIDARTDIWAFGCVLYEMLTGQPAFAGKTAVDTIATILGLEPEWSALPADIPAGLEQLLRRCLEKEREQRAGDIREVRAELDRIATEAAQTPERLRRRWPLAAAGAAVVAVGWLVVANPHGWRVRLFTTTGRAMPPAAREVTSVKARSAVAVMGFKNLSGRPDAAWLSPALSETLTTELATGGTLRAIPGESVARMKIDLAFADADSFAQDTLARIRRNIGADLVIVGSYLAVGKEGDARIRLDLRLQDAATGDVVAAFTETGGESELLDLVSRTGARLRETLGAGELSEEESAVARASQPNRDAVRLYAEGIEKLRLFDALLARDLLEEAVAADPGYAPAHSALASAWAALGYDARATAEAKTALDLARELSREQRLAIEGSYRELAHEWDKAAEIYKALWTVFPDNVEYGLRLAGVRSSGGKGKDALTAVDELRALPAPARDDPRIDLAEQAAVGSLSDFKRQQAAAERAATKGRALGARQLVARARLAEGRSLYELGDMTASVAASQEARDIFTAAGDRAGAAAALNNIGAVMSGRGNITDARAMHEEAVEICRQIGDKKGMANALNNIAVLLKDRGDLPGARKVQEQVLALRREVGDKSGEAVSLSNVGVLFFEQGNLAAAKRMYDDSLAICRETGDKRGAVRATLNKAIVLTREGDLSGARRLHEESLAIRRQIGDRIGVGVALINLADVLMSQGDLKGARSSVQESSAIGSETGNKRLQGYAAFTMGQILEAEDSFADARKAYEDALAIREQLRETLTATESRIRLAGLDIEEGRVAEAETLARSAAGESQRAKQADDEGVARAVLARALLAEGKHGQAREEIARSRALLVRSDREERLALSIVDARLSAASGAPGAAARALETILREASRSGLAGLELEARLALGEVEMRSGKIPSARARLESLRKDASAKGFKLIARKSAAANGSS
jgi:tetratricopeptide (TPR) repeat protein